jgi:hypothetical protein
VKSEEMSASPNQLDIDLARAMQARNANRKPTDEERWKATDRELANTVATLSRLEDERNARAQQPKADGSSNGRAIFITLVIIAAVVAAVRMYFFST